MAIFVDGANLFYCQRDHLGWWIDWRRFIAFFQHSHRIVGARYYRALRGPIADADEASFGQVLTSSGYTFREKPLKAIFDKYTGQTTYKGNLDVELALDAFETADGYDECVLVSGDGDFVGLVDALRRKGKTVTVVSAPGSIAYELRTAVGVDYLDLRHYRSKFEVQDLSAAQAMGAARAWIRVRAKQIATRTPPGTMPIHSNVTLDSPYKVGDRFAATVTRVTEAGAVVIDHTGVTAFLATPHLRLTGPVTDVGSLVRVGDAYVVDVIELRPGHTRAVLMVELADTDSRDMLEGRLKAPGAGLAA